ncbi:hypothetical protein [Labedaea rhizosphaerae]|uniref:hypothetical protein n=1 Tax=Labedaea rhizosphaerae TaxID=598644 RepID=UPI00105DEFDA|nr:hypothetical protein [Labedaea rhizosphaerae]
MSSPARCPELREELLARAAAIEQGAGEDDETTCWFVSLVATMGWPVRRLVGMDGARAALLLAARVPIPYQRGWVSKVSDALASSALPAAQAREFIHRVTTERGG